MLENADWLYIYSILPSISGSRVLVAKYTDICKETVKLAFDLPTVFVHAPWI